MADKRITEDDVVAELRDGMTIGIGGWGSRRKPMSLVRAIARSDLQRPHRRQLRRARRRPAVRDRQGAARSSTGSARSTRSRSSRTSAPPASRARCTTLELDEGMFLLGLQAAAWRVPFLPTRVGLGSDVRRPPARAHDGRVALRRRRGAGGRARAEPRRRAHPHAPRRRARQRPVPQRRPVLGRPVLHGGAAGVHERRADRARPSELASERPVPDAAHQPADDPRRGRGAERRALHRVRARLRPRRGVPEGVRRAAPRTPTRGRRGRRSTSTAATTPSTGRWSGCD